MQTVSYTGNFFNGVSTRYGTVTLSGTKIVHVNEHEKDKKDAVNTIFLEDDQILIPGFIDAHGHVGTLLGNKILHMIPLPPSPVGSVNTIDEFFATVQKEYMKDPYTCILGVDYDDSFLGHHPTYDIKMLDGRYLLKEIEAINDKFLFIHCSGHMAVMSKSFLKNYYDVIDDDGRVILNWQDRPHTEDNPRPFLPFDLDLIEVDADRRPTGLIKEAAWLAFVPYLATLFSQEDSLRIAKIFGDLQNEILSMGITSIQDGASSQETSSMFKAFDDLGLMKLSIFAFWNCQDITGTEAESAVCDILSKHSSYPSTETCRVFNAGAKLFLDGSPQGGTAAVTEPYLNTDNRGVLSWEGKEEELKEKLRIYIYEAKTRLTAHCNGDAAIEQLIRLCGEIFDERHCEPFPSPAVIIHCQLMSNHNKHKLLKLRERGCDLRPSFFPQHTYFFGDYESEILGKHRISQMSPCRWAEKNKVPFTIHADGTVTPFWPKYLVSTAVNRTGRSGHIHGDDECISVNSALQALTSSVASQLGIDYIGGYGRISEGYMADVVIVRMSKKYKPPPLHKISSDTFGTNADGHFVVDAVIKHGEVVYKNSNQPDLPSYKKCKPFKYHKCQC